MAPNDSNGETPSTEKRKREHIETVLGEDVTAKGVTTGFERFFLEHVALPEISLDEVDLSTTIFAKTLKAPVLISSMTGGTERARRINENLAAAAQACGIAMGLGSQRAAIEDSSLAYSYRVRDVAPDVLLFANLGAVQFNYGYGVDEARKAVEMIGADALFLHLNPLQEAVQPEGDTDWGKLFRAIEKTVSALDVPVVVKEIGNGISGTVARRLAECGVAAIDVAGAGGTSWSEVEAFRQSDPFRRRVAHSFAGWGMPAALALIEARAAVSDIPVFASGGLRSGVDLAKAIRLGASLCGVAAPTLGNADQTAESVTAGMSALIEELRIAAFCTGSRNLESLRSAVIRRADDWSVV